MINNNINALKNVFPNNSIFITLNMCPVAVQNLFLCFYKHNFRSQISLFCPSVHWISILSIVFIVPIV